MTVRYFIGVPSSKLTLTGDHEDYTTHGKVTLGKGTVLNLEPWELRHVESVQESGSTTNSTIGMPNKPAECVYIYDTGGPVRTFNITGKRYDHEETVSNLDFLFNQFNLVGSEVVKGSDVPLVDTTVTTTYHSVGIEWMESTLQTTLKGYVFIRTTDDTTDTRIPFEELGSDTYGEVFYVAVTGFSASFDVDNPGTMNYTITLTERSSYTSGQTYREYIPQVKRLD